MATNKKNGRGPAQQPDEWNSGKKLDVTLNAEGQIVGSDYATFASAVGVLARHGSSFPITVKNWHRMPPTSKEDVWKEVKVSEIFVYLMFFVHIKQNLFTS